MSTRYDDWNCDADIRIQAFIDDELPAAERQRMLEALEADVRLREQVCRMRMTKEWVRQAFEEVAPPPRLQPHRAGLPRRFGLAAACLLVFLCGALVGGWCEHARTPALQAVVLHRAAVHGHRVLLHLAEDDPAKFHTALTEAERLLERYAGEGGRVEVLTNAGGIDLLRADVSPYVRQVAGLMQRYDGRITFIACANAIRRVRERGEKVILIDHVRTDTTAIDHILHRLEEGWTYVRI
ncbi:MAG: hypothetical protein D6721_01315 [Gammaproteobacteria bacterium]|nr:MAG: hypothetical protein D6721_01315 [Gammaproteobacteria bacterium]